jgi:PAS domain S-box-containing protein
MSATQILVVEDERIVATALKNELEQFGYSVSGIASSAAEAVDKAVRGKPDLVLMDIHLQGETDGIEAAQEIRSRCGTPVVYLSAFSDCELLARAGQTQAYGYLLKPYEERELQTTIEIALAKRRAEERTEECGRWLGAILDGIDDAVIATDPDNRVHFMNLASEAMTGWRAEDVVGQAFGAVCNLVEENCRISVQDLAGRAICESRVVEFPAATRLATRDGRLTPVEGYLSPIHDVHGEFLGMVLNFRCRSGVKLNQNFSREMTPVTAGLVAVKPPKTHASRLTVLLSDADPTVRDNGRRALEMQGYRVLTAKDGLEAVALYQQEETRIDLVLVDLNMPCMAGPAVLQRLLDIDPHVRVLFTSSYFAEDLTQGSCHTRGVIGKPWSQNELVQMVGRALARNSEETGQEQAG